MLTPRQGLLLTKVIEGFADTGQPIGSKLLAGDPSVEAGSSTVRGELAALEGLGLLAHPHTSAGRVPTEAGYRYFVDNLLDAATPDLALELARSELEEAIRLTTDALSQVTDLLAIVSAPPISTTTIRHVELLVLQPRVLMVVVITSTGGVSKRMFTYGRPIDTGLADWAGSYLCERVVGLGLGARTLRTRLIDPSLPASEREFLAVMAPAFVDLAESADDSIFVEGTARLLSEDRFRDVGQLNELLAMLERRVSLLGVLSAALDERDTYVRIGRENATPALRELSLVAANYGLPQRNLGTVSVIGPTRMDYALAVGAVRAAAHELSRFVEDVY